MQQESNDNASFDQIKNKLWFYIAVILFVLFTRCSDADSAIDAFESGNLAYGSTYNDVVNCLGKPDDVQKRNGEITYCYYRNKILFFIPFGKHVQICFSPFTDGTTRVTGYYE